MTNPTEQQHQELSTKLENEVRAIINTHIKEIEQVPVAPDTLHAPVIVCMQLATINALVDYLTDKKLYADEIIPLVANVTSWAMHRWLEVIEEKINAAAEQDGTHDENRLQ